MHLVRNTFALHFVSLIADAERNHIGPYQHSVDFDFASIEATRPATVRSIEIEPEVLAVDGDVVSHEKQLSVAGCQLPVTHLSLIASPLSWRQPSSSRRRWVCNSPNHSRLRVHSIQQPRNLRAQTRPQRLPLLRVPSHPSPFPHVFVSRGGRENRCRFSRRENPDRSECGGTTKYWS